AIESAIAEPFANDAYQLVAVREADEVEDTAPQKWQGQLALRVAGNHDDRPRLRPLPTVRTVELTNFEAHAVKLIEKIVWEIARSFVDLVNQNDAAATFYDCLAERFIAYVILRITGSCLASLNIVEALHGIEGVKQVLRPGGRAREKRKRRPESELFGQA